MAGIFDALVKAAKGAKGGSKTQKAARRLVSETAQDDAAPSIDPEIASVTSPRAKTVKTVFDSPSVPTSKRGIEKLGKASFPSDVPVENEQPKDDVGPMRRSGPAGVEAEFRPMPKRSASADADRDDDGISDKSEMPPPAKDVVLHEALRGMPDGGKPIIGSNGDMIGWAKGSPRGKARMGTVKYEGISDPLPAYFPSGQGSVSGVIPEPEPTAENSYRMSARKTAKIPESVVQARERTDKEQLDWGAGQHNLALQALQFDPAAQEASGLAPGQLGTIIRGARAGDDQAVDMLDILLGQGDTSNENVAELKALLRTPGLSAKDRKAIIAEINKVQAPGREQSFRSDLEEKKRTAAADALEKKQLAAQREFEMKRTDASTSREDAQAHAREMQEERLRAAMRDDTVRELMKSPVKMSDAELEALGATLPPDVKDTVLNTIKAKQAFLSEQNDRRLGADEIDNKLKMAKLNEYEAGQEADKFERAKDLLQMVTESYRKGVAGGAPLSDERMARWVDELVVPLQAESPQALLEYIKSAGAKPQQDESKALGNMLAEAKSALLSGQAGPQHYWALHKDAEMRKDPMAIAAEQARAEMEAAFGERLPDEAFAAMLASKGGNYRALIAAIREELANPEGGE